MDGMNNIMDILKCSMEITRTLSETQKITMDLLLKISSHSQTKPTHIQSSYIPTQPRPHCELKDELQKPEPTLSVGLRPKSVAPHEMIDQYDSRLTRTYPDQNDNKIVSEMVGKRVLVTSTQYPGYGGGATNGYNIAKFLKKHGCVVGCIFFENYDKYDDICLFDPENIGNVFRCPRWSYYIGKRDAKFVASDMRNYKKTINASLGGAPDIILSKNYVAPVESKLMYPTVPVLYLISGSKHVTGMNSTFEHILSIDQSKLDVCDYEVRANQDSTLIIPNSVISHMVFSHIYPEFRSKIVSPIDTSLLSLFETETIHFSERKYDIGVIVSNHNRKIKNSSLANKILCRPEMNQFSKIIVGNNHDTVFSSDLPQTIFRPMLKNADVLELLKNTKIILLTSLFDASPNIFTEAISCGCFPILTHNVGNSEKYNDYYKVKNLTNIEEWVTVITRVLGDKNHPEYVMRPTDIKLLLFQVMYSALTIA